MMTSMHQNLLAAAVRLAPWSGLLRRLPLARAHPVAFPRTGVIARAVAEPPSFDRPAAAPAQVSCLDPAHQATVFATPRPARAMLRVVRIVETDQELPSSGRVVMCGRMADVCAELDRMVEREAVLLARTRPLPTSIAH